MLRHVGSTPTEPNSAVVEMEYTPGLSPGAREGIEGSTPSSATWESTEHKYYLCVLIAALLGFSGGAKGMLISRRAILIRKR